MEPVRRDEDLDWRKAVPALSSADGDREEAASLLWRQSRRDTLLREDLVRAACALLALAPAAAEPTSGWKRRPGPLSRLDRDPEIVRQARDRFWPDRTPDKSAIWRWWRRIVGERQAG